MSDPFANEAVQLMASQLMAGNARKYDRKIYWRKPVTNPDGTRNVEGGWITVATSDPYRFLEFVGLGWEPLFKYGQVLKHFQEDAAAGTADSYGRWGAILMHPDGPAEFPVEQVMTYRWYIPERCPVPGVRFPQLAGTEITEYDCPECNNVQYGKPVHLARHLSVTHNYDRADLIALGEQLGISFEKEKVQDGRIQRTYRFDPEFAAAVAAAPAAPPTIEPEPEPVAVQHVRPAPRPDSPPAKSRASTWTPERRAEASRKMKERVAAKASA